MTDQPTTEPSATGLRIEHGWLVEETTGCTCAGGTEESSYLHEPGCGLTPLQRLDNLPGWPALQPAADLGDLGDLTTWTPAEVAASPVGASRLIQRLDAVVTAVREVREEYFDEDGHTEPEDVWRLHRDLGRALNVGA